MNISIDYFYPDGTPGMSGLSSTPIPTGTPTTHTQDPCKEIMKQKESCRNSCMGSSRSSCVERCTAVMKNDCKKEGESCMIQDENGITPKCVGFAPGSPPSK